MTCNVQLKRRGFTIVELLVVLVIISILAALSLGVIGGMLTSARTAATSATLSKINDRIKNRAQSLSEVDMAQYEIAANNQGAQTAAEQKVLARKLLFKESFPQTWVEFYDSWPNVWNQIYIESQAAIGNPGATPPIDGPSLPSITAQIASESAEVLYYTLTRAPIAGAGKRKVISGVAQTAADEFGDADVMDTDGDGLMEFVDGWENPLRFYRWPTRIVRSMATASDAADVTVAITPAQLAAAKTLIPAITTIDFASKDPDDPYDAMSNAATFAADQFEVEYHTTRTYHQPLVVSVGEDEKLGLYEPTDFTNFGNLGQISNLEEVNDNLSNHNNRPGGN